MPEKWHVTFITSFEVVNRSNKLATDYRKYTVKSTFFKNPQLTREMEMLSVVPMTY